MIFEGNAMKTKVFTPPHTRKPFCFKRAENVVCYINPRDYNKDSTDTGGFFTGRVVSADKNGFRIKLNKQVFATSKKDGTIVHFMYNSVFLMSQYEFKELSLDSEKRRRWVAGIAANRLENNHTRGRYEVFLKALEEIA